jgi:hypothetical protein
MSNCHTCDTTVSFAVASGDETLQCHPDQFAVLEEAMCQHQPQCPDAFALDRAAARVLACHPEQGWSLLCNGVVLFDDEGMLLLGGGALSAGRVPVMARAA